MSISFIHAADIHLDRPFLGLNGCPDPLLKRIRKSTFTALSSLVKTAIARKVDFIVLAGDIFDSATRGLRAETLLREEMKKLSTYDIPVFMIHGNHDPLDGHWSGLSYGENVHVFGPNPDIYHLETMNHEHVHIYGFSYPTQHVVENRVDQYVKADKGGYHIAMLHGSLKGSVDHDVYAPFTIQTLKNKQMDYWALGHIHKREILHQDPPVIYPGSLQGLSVKETGEKGFHYVTMDQTQVKPEFIKTSDILWDEVVLDVSHLDSFEALMQTCENVKEGKRETAEGVLLRLKVVGESEILQDDIRFMDLLEALRTGEEDRHNFVWITDIQDESTPLFDRDKLKNSSHFMGDIIRLIEQKDSIQNELQPLYQHHQAKRYLASLTKEEQLSMLKEAEKILLSGLHKQVKAKNAGR